MTGTGRRVVVGVDDSDNSLVALDAGAAEAALRRRPLHVVHADPVATAANPAAGPSPDESGRWVNRAVERVLAAYPRISVTGEVARGFPQPVLVEASRDGLGEPVSAVPRAVLGRGRAPILDRSVAEAIGETP